MRRPVAPGVSALSMGARDIGRVPVQRLEAGHVHIGLVHTQGLHPGGVLAQNGMEPTGDLQVVGVLSRQVDCMGTESLGGLEGHARMEAIGPCFVGGAGHDATAASLAADGHRYALQRGVQSTFHCHKEGVQVDVEDTAVGHGRFPSQQRTDVLIILAL